MSIVLHDGPEQGLYDWRFVFFANRLDGGSNIRKSEYENESRGGDAKFTCEAFLPKYNVTLRYWAIPGGHCKIEIDGETEKEEAFREIAEREQSQLLAVCEAEDKD